MKFRKKPIVIEAIQFDESKIDDAMAFTEYNLTHKTIKINGLLGPETVSIWSIRTDHGPLEIQNGDWIIKGTEGEYYPCKPDVFDKIYEKAD